jgi:nicotinamidase-related amidase
MLLDAQDSQLVLMDYQMRLMPAIHDASALTANAANLARVARLFAVPVWGTEHNPAGLGETIALLRPLMDNVLRKMRFSAAEALMERLRQPARVPQGSNARSLPRHLQKAMPASQPARSSMVLAGCEAHVCLMQTALDLLEEEFEVWVVTDACGSRTERNRDAAFDRLASAGAELVTTEMVVFEWLRTAEHPLFDKVLALLR